MSRTEPRRWLALGLAAFLLRAGVAVLTEYKPLFPSYYYHDAVFAEELAAKMADAWGRGEAFRTRYAPPQRVHAALLAAPYLLIGRRPLVDKVLNAAVGALAVVLLGLGLAEAFTAEIGLLSAAAIAAWPSHVFYTSQNFKESPTFALTYAALAAALLLLAVRSRAKPALIAASFLLAALCVGFLRSYVLLILCASVAIGTLAAVRRAAAPRWLLAAALAAPLVYKPLSYWVFDALLSSPMGMEADGGEADFVRGNKFDGTVQHSALSPQGISDFRRRRQDADRRYAQAQLSREIGTQLFPEARFESWLDIALFMPKAAFQVLFMPLPGLYPMDGKLGRWLAAAENLFLLTLAGLAALGLSRSWPSPPRAVLLAFFLAMAAGSALMEFDLGSASRHKLLYLPMLFPFAAEELLRRRRA